MKNEGLDSNAEEPLYKQLAKIISGKILEEGMDSGTLIPSESEMIEKYNVSRTTVREAIQLLVNKGVLEKIWGKGTIVKSSVFVETLGELTGFAEEIMEQGYVPSAKLISAEMKSNHLYEMSKLSLSPQDEILIIERIRIADDLPIAYERSCWPKNIGKLLLKENLNEIRFYDLLEQKYNIYLTEADESISATNASGFEAGLLGVGPGTALLEMNRISYGVDGAPLEFTCTKYRSDTYSYNIHLKRTRKTEGMKGE
ncbi:GntR family transcriptional regulator [Sporosarcina sp. Marseille-Q4063]|uniref:GntR family transcriptional regulator n=1 Tax=Sporosarcina sp. Marseille-Q4063 TaxID=2810514 RepID=UPI001BAF3F32|nr:GntR family transcriptional regulator [Sporosarcina sp. Marseille-Q4063]QUW21268.1 GntR family transcriptional regulator [Sporosarcina sp. Marseille-Q4063]